MGGRGRGKLSARATNWPVAGHIPVRQYYSHHQRWKWMVRQVRAMSTGWESDEANGNALGGSVARRT